MKISSVLKPTILAMTLAATSTSFAADKIVGSGSSFIYPVMTAWAKEFNKENDVRIDYQSKGSGAGVRDMLSNVVQFAASDSAMDSDEEAKVKGGAIFLPVTAGEVVISYNLKGLKDLKLSRDVYVDIFLGEIPRWNDKRIAADNPGVKLPDSKITVVTRSDSSGTTYAFTNHLNEVSAEWKEVIGKGKSVQWPKKSNFVAAPRNDGVAATIMQTPGALGYIEYGYAKVTGQPMASLENKDGYFVAPSAETGAAALANVEWPENLVAFAPDPSGENAYPITTFSWMMLYQNNSDGTTAETMRNFAKYIVTDGQALSTKMGYIPVPDSLKANMLAAIEKIK
ncbi:phosphate ABC transporter substrate-binding protein PstS [Vibrio sp.]|nr:phosphate ABC transporter substrate-binding protein PstS [Vibrio sp.]